MKVSCTVLNGRGQARITHMSLSLSPILSDGLDVVRVLHASRDINEHFDAT